MISFEAKTAIEVFRLASIVLSWICGHVEGDSIDASNELILQIEHTGK